MKKGNNSGGLPVAPHGIIILAAAALIVIVLVHQLGFRAMAAVKVN